MINRVFSHIKWTTIYNGYYVLLFCCDLAVSKNPVIQMRLAKYTCHMSGDVYHYIHYGVLTGWKFENIFKKTLNRWFYNFSKEI